MLYECVFAVERLLAASMALYLFITLSWFASFLMLIMATVPAPSVLQKDHAHRTFLKGLSAILTVHYMQKVMFQHLGASKAVLLGTVISKP